MKTSGEQSLPPKFFFLIHTKKLSQILDAILQKKTVRNPFLQKTVFFEEPRTARQEIFPAFPPSLFSIVFTMFVRT